MTSECLDNELILEATDDLDNIIAAPPEELSDDEIFNKNNTDVLYKKIAENDSAGRLQIRVPDAPDNLIELVYRKKCLECSAILTTISSALMHYNSVKHQNKLALKFLPHGTYNLPLSKEEIREIETGVCKTGEPNPPGNTKPKTSKVPFRELVKKFDIKENVRNLDLQFCRLCETPFSSKIAALRHYSGKKHKKHAENWSIYNPNKPIDTKDDLKCDVCNVIVESSSHMEAHLTGKKHQMKMKIYLERINAGAIAPPMSSRGFCDFNNVEREEANPVDPSRFIQESSDTLEKLTGSFLSRFESNDHQQRYQENYTEQDYGFSRNLNSAYLNSEFKEEYKPNSSFDFMNRLRLDITRGFSNLQDDRALYSDNRLFDPSHHNDSLPRSQFNAPYAPNFVNKVGSRFPVQSFGPTKFRYSRKQLL